MLQNNDTNAYFQRLAIYFYDEFATNLMICKNNKSLCKYSLLTNLSMKMFTN